MSLLLTVHIAGSEHDRMRPLKIQDGGFRCLDFHNESDLNLKWASTRIGKIYLKYWCAYNRGRGWGFGIRTGRGRNICRQEKVFLHLAPPLPRGITERQIGNVPGARGYYFTTRNSSYNYFCWWKLSFQCCFVGFGGRHETKMSLAFARGCWAHFEL